MKKNVILPFLFMGLTVSTTLSVHAQNTKAQEIVNLAQSQEGQNYQKYSNGTTPWCALFVCWVYRQAGIPLEGGNSWVYSFLNAANNGRMGTITTNPQPGDLVIYGNCSKNEDCNHVSILISKNADGSFVTMGGNENGIGNGNAHSQSSKVCRTVKTAGTTVRAFIRPFALGSATTTPPTWANIPNGVYNLRLANGKTLDAHLPTVNTNGCMVQVYDPALSNANQQWVITALGAGKYSIQVKASNKVLDLNASNTANGGGITLWDKNGAIGSPNQQWMICAVANGFYKIVPSIYPNRALSMYGQNLNANIQVHLWDFFNAPQQLWKIEAAPSVAPPPPVVVTPPVVTEVPDPTPGQQDGWRWCSKCQAIFFGGAASRCPTGGSHLVGTRSYLPFHGAGTLGQVDWRWCNKCSGLFYNGHATHGVCPAGGQHTGTNSWNYHLNFAGDAPGQGAFRWCNKCEILHYGGMQGVCPAGGAHGDINNSYDYKIPFRD